MEPTAARERIVLLDILRGLAVFGMFTVNMTTDLPWGWAFGEQPLDNADRTVVILIDLLTNGKFITIFSFLFGVGFFLQLERVRDRGVPFLAAYLRRLAVLFFIGALAIVAGLGAHILIDYSIFGFLLLLFPRRSPRFLLATVVVCFLISAVSGNIEDLSDLIGSTEEQSDRAESVDDGSSTEALAENERGRVYREGSFKEIARHRAFRLPTYVLSWKQRLWDADLLGLMLLGFYVCRRGALQDPAVRKKMARTALPWLLSIGAAGMVIYVWLHYFVAVKSDLLTLIGNLAFWGAPVLGLGYVAIITLLLEKEACRRALFRFTSVGRLALTNYLFHGFVIAAFAYPWGLGLYGEMGPFWGLMSVFAIFPLMVIASSWWIARFQFGPIEWLWRTLTYGQMQSLR